MAKSKFDFSLLKPVGEKSNSFESQLKPLVTEEEDAGAYLDSLPQQEGFLRKLPRNILTGLAHAGRNLHNLPHDISKLVEWPVEKAVGPLKHPLSSYLPNDTSDYTDAFGGDKEKDSLMDKLIKGGIEFAPDIISGASLAKNLAQRVTGVHHLKEVKRAVEQKGLQEFAYPKSMIKEAEKFLPATKSTKELISEVNAGKYNPAFKLQSQVGHHQRMLAKSPLASENSIMAPKAGELKQQMMGHLESVLRNANHVEEADMLRKGINNYRDYKKFMDTTLPIIKKLGVPTTILSAIGLTYKGTKKALTD